jgi:hypothetical protein
MEGLELANGDVLAGRRQDIPSVQRDSEQGCRYIGIDVDTDIDIDIDRYIIHTALARTSPVYNVSRVGARRGGNQPSVPNRLDGSAAWCHITGGFSIPHPHATTWCAWIMFNLNRSDGSAA